MKNPFSPVSKLMFATYSSTCSILKDLARRMARFCTAPSLKKQFFRMQCARFMEPRAADILHQIAGAYANLDWEAVIDLAPFWRGQSGGLSRSGGPPNLAPAGRQSGGPNLARVWPIWRESLRLEIAWRNLSGEMPNLARCPIWRIIP